MLAQIVISPLLLISNAVITSLNVPFLFFENTETCGYFPSPCFLDVIDIE